MNRRLHLRFRPVRGGLGPRQTVLGQIRGAGRKAEPAGFPSGAAARCRGRDLLAVHGWTIDEVLAWTTPR